MRRIELEVQERFFGFDTWSGQGERGAESCFSRDISAAAQDKERPVFKVSRLRKRVEREEAFNV